MNDRYRRITVKIGSNVLARADGTLDVTRMSALVDQVCALREGGIEVIVISSGAVASGRSQLAGKESRLPSCGTNANNAMDTEAGSLPSLDKVSSRQLYSAVGQVKLMSRYADLFHSHGVEVGQVLTMKENFSTRRHYLNQRNCMSVMLEYGVVPIVNENDTVSVTELMFTDNDELSGLVAAMMDCDALVILSNIDGVYDGDPKDPTSRVIPLIKPDEDFSRYISAERSGFGRGGMITKYNIARKVADEGVTVIIANGKREHILTDLLIDGTPDSSRQGATVLGASASSSPSASAQPQRPPATVFAASATPKSNLKRWIAHSEGFAKGSLVIDRRAVEAICSDTAVSLLPVGVVCVEGDFEKDDLVRIVDEDGRQIGIGRSTYSAAEARALIGKHDCRPIIHYDYLYLENV